MKTAFVCRAPTKEEEIRNKNPLFSAQHVLKTHGPSRCQPFETKKNGDLFCNACCWNLLQRCFCTGHLIEQNKHTYAIFAKLGTFVDRTGQKNSGEGGHRKIFFYSFGKRVPSMFRKMKSCFMLIDMILCMWRS